MTPQTRPWRLAVAGCGAAAFGLHLPLLASHSAFEVTALADRDTERARTAAARFAVPRVAASTKDLLDGADMLVILTGVHGDLIETALDAGTHVFTEKPVGLDITRTRKMADRAGEAGLLLEVGAMRAHDPALHAALAAVPDPAGGWLIKADGVDEAARRRLLPSGFSPYTFAGDPPQTAPAQLEAPHQVSALQILLWQGYHLLTALALAVPGATPAACTLDVNRQSLHALLYGPAAEPYTLVISATAPGRFLEQIHFSGPADAATVDFARPYEPSTTTRVTTAAGERSGFSDPFAAMWQAVSDRLAGQCPADLPTSTALAIRVEDLALALAAICRPGPHPRKD
ncbi:Gfo/Idh/MocA family protein [Streptomyces corynorhini]|uniref:Gfo/Idh/MocA family oxidoreductase n=1 Tax=Streptomyces corynorhini TaxID=2282652 RepID=A0A370B377_9ACTN|nr:Gfo/Idh/MocA family oxidoreductase [Streptomyces corynorhini]RDG36258.1 gfo/Idh/MocA family oxidoreductase [Streptomyces corynorhini]